MPENTACLEVAYTPKFLTPPMVKERGRTRPPPNLRNTQQDMGYNYGQQYNYGMMSDTVSPDMGMPPQQQLPPPGFPVQPVTEEPEDFTIKVGWRLKDIDYPICLGNSH